MTSTTSHRITSLISRLRISRPQFPTSPSPVNLVHSLPLMSCPRLPGPRSLLFPTSPTRATLLLAANILSHGTTFLLWLLLTRLHLRTHLGPRPVVLLRTFSFLMLSHPGPSFYLASPSPPLAPKHPRPTLLLPARPFGALWVQPSRPPPASPVARLLPRTSSPHRLRPHFLPAFPFSHFPLPTPLSPPLPATMISPLRPALTRPLPRFPSPHGHGHNSFSSQPFFPTKPLLTSSPSPLPRPRSYLSGSHSPVSRPGPQPPYSSGHAPFSL